MEGWRDGRMEGCWDVGVENWRDGGLEGWRGGRQLHTLVLKEHPVRDIP